MKGAGEDRVASSFRCKERGCVGVFSFAQVQTALRGLPNAEELGEKVEDLLNLYRFVEKKPAGAVLL